MSDKPKKVYFGGKANTNGFAQNPQNIGKGRPKKIYTVLKAKGYNKADIKAALGELGTYSLKELREVIKSDKMPIIARIVAKAFVQAYDSGDWAKVKDIIEHQIGKPTQSIDNTHQVVQEQPLFDLDALNKDKDS